jgi:hypothetical protein
MRDMAQGPHFHLGEVLVNKARIACRGVEGYGMRRGRDLEAAMAMAIVDLCVASGLQTEACNAFVTSEAGATPQTTVTPCGGSKPLASRWRRSDARRLCSLRIRQSLQCDP